MKQFKYSAWLCAFIAASSQAQVNPLSTVHPEQMAALNAGRQSTAPYMKLLEAAQNPGEQTPVLHTDTAKQADHPPVAAPVILHEASKKQPVQLKQPSTSFEPVAVPVAHRSVGKLSYTYHLGKPIAVSNNEVNVIQFDIPITHVSCTTSEIPSQINYLNKNKAFTFSLGNMVLPEVQFIVSLANGKILSLIFQPAQVPGRVVHVPTQVTGTLPVKREPNADGQVPSYEQTVIQLMKTCLKNQLNTANWSLVLNNHHVTSLMNEFTSRWHKRYINSGLILDQYELCAKNRLLSLSEDQFYQGKHNVAITLTQRKLQPHQCTQLVILSTKKHSANPLLMPYAGGAYV